MDFSAREAAVKPSAPLHQHPDAADARQPVVQVAEADDRLNKDRNPGEQTRPLAGQLGEIGN